MLYTVVIHRHLIPPGIDVVELNTTTDQKTVCIAIVDEQDIIAFKLAVNPADILSAYTTSPI